MLMWIRSLFGNVPKKSKVVFNSKERIQPTLVLDPETQPPKKKISAGTRTREHSPHDRMFSQAPVMQHILTDHGDNSSDGGGSCD